MEKKTHSHDKYQHSGLSRRGLLKGSGALVAAGGIAGVTELAEAKKPDAGGQDLAFVNGKIHTMDGSNSGSSRSYRSAMAASTTLATGSAGAAATRG